MKILHVIDNLKVGGTTNLAFRTIQQLIKSGHEVSVCVLTGTQNDSVIDNLPPKTRFPDLQEDYRKPFVLRQWAREVQSAIRDLKPDIVHSWLWRSDVAAATAASRTKTPHLVHVLDRRTWQESTKLKHRYRRWFTKRRFCKADSRFLAVSQAAADYAIEHLRIAPSKMKVAHNSIESAPYFAIPDSKTWTNDNTPLRLGIASRIHPEKGHLYLLKAIKLIAERGLNVSLHVTGDGPSRPMLEQFVTENELQETVHFVGWVDSVIEFLEGIDVFMVPSIDSEGLPTTILEAMAAGRIVIATDIGGATEAITPDAGRIVPAKDVNSLVDAVAEVYGNRMHAAAMCLAARERIKTAFDMPIMMETINRQYDYLIHQSDRR